MEKLTVNDYFIGGIREFVEKHGTVTFSNGYNDCESTDKEMCFCDIEFDFPVSREIEDFKKFTGSLEMLCNADYPGDWSFLEYNHMDEISNGDNNLLVTMHRNY